MNKRQKKKMLKKTLPIIADEYPLCAMNKEECKKAFEEAENYRLKYGYRKKYANLKKEKFLRYSYSYVKQSKEMQNLMNLARGRKPQ